MNPHFFFTLLFVAVAGAACLTYIENENSKRFLSKRKKGKGKTRFWTPASFEIKYARPISTIPGFVTLTN